MQAITASAMLVVPPTSLLPVVRTGVVLLLADVGVTAVRSCVVLCSPRLSLGTMCSLQRA